jgi:hypothetical protein
LQQPTKESINRTFFSREIKKYLQGARKRPTLRSREEINASQHKIN